MKQKVIICHAYNTHHYELWYGWLKDNLEKHGYDVEVLNFPNISSPKEVEWVETIHDAVPKTNPSPLLGIVLVAEQYLHISINIKYQPKR
jgi:predicted alpha/beta hydrolase family esterase